MKKIIVVLLVAFLFAGASLMGPTVASAENCVTCCVDCNIEAGPCYTGCFAVQVACIIACGGPNGPRPACEALCITVGWLCSVNCDQDKWACMDDCPCCGGC